MKRPLDVELELESDRIFFGGPTRTEIYLEKLELQNKRQEAIIKSLEENLDKMKSFYKNWR